MDDEEQDAFLASMAPEERLQLQKDLLATGELGDAGGSMGSESRIKSSARLSDPTSGGHTSEAPSAGGQAQSWGGQAQSRASSIKQQSQQRELTGAMRSAQELKEANEDAQALRYTGSDFRVKQQLGLAPTGELPGELDHIEIPQPSEFEMAALVQLGYSPAQAALICVVDALIKQVRVLSHTVA